MATPLHQLVDTVLFDPAERELFRQAPETYLRTAGYDDLDAADVQEAMFVLADGASPDRADLLITGGRAIGDVANVDDLAIDGTDDVGLEGAGDAFGSALEALPLEVDEIDGLDVVDDASTAAPSEPAPSEGLDTTFGAGAEPDIDTSDISDDESPDSGHPDEISLEDTATQLPEGLNLVGPDPEIDRFATHDEAEADVDDVPGEWHDFEP